METEKDFYAELIMVKKDSLIKGKYIIFERDYGKTDSNLKVGEIASQSTVFPSSPNPKQTPHFSVEYKSKGFGDLTKDLSKQHRISHIDSINGVVYRDERF